MIAMMTTQRSLAYVIGAIIFIGAAGYIAAQVAKGRKELGSEIELAPNRKPYLSDDQLEGPKLNAALWTSFGLLAVISLILPIYWIAEPGRQEGAKEYGREIAVERGLHTYETGAQCVNCHGPDGSGGSAKFTVTDEDGNYVSTVQWTAPALNTLLYRFSKSEVRFILEYGRPGTPMAAWGVPGGGPLTSQTLDNVIEYLWSIQVTPDKMKADLDAVIKEFDSSLYDRVVANREKNAKVIDATSTDYTRMDLADELRLGEFLFYLNDGRVGGNAMSCARCHVSGASYGKPWKPISELARGRSAYDLTNVEKNLTEKQHFTLVNNGSEYGKLYGANSQGSGRMPGFGVNANNGTTDDVRKFGAAGMLTTEEVWAVVTYERHLATERAAIDAATAASETQNSEASK